MKDTISKFKQIPFPDKYVQNYLFDIQNDVVIITILESPGESFCSIIAKSVIGVTHIGHWDEWTIEELSIQQGGDLKNLSLEKVNANYTEVDSLDTEKQPTDNFYQLKITLVDGVEIKIVAKSFEIEGVK